MTGRDHLKETFFLECEELLETLDDGLEQLSRQQPGALPEAEVNAVFRAVHSIKGGAAAFRMDLLVRFAHALEDALDELRGGRLEPGADTWQLLRRAGDYLAELIAAAQAGTQADAAASEPLVQALAALGQGAAPAEVAAPATPLPGSEVAEPPAPAGFAPIALDLPDALATSDAGTARYEIALAPGKGFFENGHDPVHLFRELDELGALTVSVEAEALPPIASLQPMECHLRWYAILTTDRPEAEIRAVFEFVETHADLTIKPAATAPAAPAGDPAPAQRQDREGATDGPPPPAPGASDAADPAGPALPRAPGQTAERLAAPAAAPQPVPPRLARATVRVDLARVDELINIVGELVINQSYLSAGIARAGLSGQAQLAAGLDEFRNLSRQIQEGVMAIRAQSLKSLFQRMGRITREAAAAAGKPLRFEVSGAETEVDTTMVERLVDPLTHILRNAVDHGLEPPDVRAAAGKPAEGHIRLAAAHRSGRVLIELTDDGGGIDRDRVLATARRKGLVAATETLAESEIDALLFRPGFSTRSTVTDLSGRGVGMDIVRSAIHALGGRVTLASVPGAGTTVSISLPLTLAVLEGMIVRVAGHRMVVPITAITETLRLSAEEVEGLCQGHEMIRLRGRLVPVLDLGAVFGFRQPGVRREERLLLLIETEKGAPWALAVDAICDQAQVVIKSLEQNYGAVPGIAAATILGDGRIALILDTEEVVRIARQSTAGSHVPAPEAQARVAPAQAAPP